MSVKFAKLSLCALIVQQAFSSSMLTAYPHAQSDILVMILQEHVLHVPMIAIHVTQLEPAFPAMPPLIIENSHR